MRAWFFALLTMVLFVISVFAELYAVYLGVGLPREFNAMYLLDSYQLLTGLGKQVRKPVVYEWTVSTILQPGETTVEVGFQETLLRGGNYSVTITVASEKNVHEGNGGNLRFTIYRNEVFLVLRIRIVLHTDREGVIPDMGLVYVKLVSTGR